MAVAPRPWQNPSLPPPSQKPKRKHSPQKLGPGPTAKIPPSPPRVKNFPKPTSKQQSSFQFRLLTMGQQFSNLITFSLVGAALLVYSWTVYTQELWGKEFSRLMLLQSNERNLVAANEAIKQQAAQQAETPETGLADPTPDSNLYMPPATGTLIQPQAPATVSNGDTSAPVGY